MKNLKTLFVASIVAVTFGSCTDEKKTQADKAVNNFTSYVDSLSGVAAENMSESWESVENTYIDKKIQAETALENVEDRMEWDNKVDESSKKYEEYKMNYLAIRQTMEAQNAKAKLRSSLFNGREIGNDMDFSWVNKDNILNTFDTFVNTVADNKDKYSREDWDEIKMLYEALGTRKNTVEKEGLTSSDNMKIAGLKIKFAPMYTVNRMGAKAEENAEAKE
ncbi:DUF6565 domain-containing protein [Flavobacterium orientale]|uniref:DUF6565 domain-containing protein n=1 Tax=Flavobacterium orientale TaxID=1756020 RepID=A0A916Y988_9FLAO|nr:DUF6565 domain-containing protein [Flavobacterium orientale]GGD35529.1 hypothetical protein GCM10011343_26770 [Flavobacterium orientale]